MPDFKTIEPIKHDGVDYPSEVDITLSDKEAKPLLLIGAIEAAVIHKPIAPEGEEKITAIKDAISKLNIDTAENWLKDGRPDTKAIINLTGWPVSAAERDAVWEQVKPAA